MIDFRFLELGDKAPISEPYAIVIAQKGQKKTWAKLQIRTVLPGPHLIGNAEDWKWTAWEDVPLRRSE